MRNYNVKKYCILALLTALEIVLSRFLSVNAWNLKIGFNFVPIVIAAMIFGPLAGGLVAALGDFIGALLFPIGAYFPGFTLTAFITGIIFGLFLHKKYSTLNVILSVLINQLFFSLLLNSYWISVLYGSPYVPLLATRLIQCAILIPVQIVVIILLSKSLPSIKKAASL